MCHRRRGGGGEAITPSHPEMPLQALHLAYEAGPSATYDVPGLSSSRPSRGVVSSVAGLIITVTDGKRVKGKSSNAKQGARRQ
jgi:hypothetical protein